MGLSGMDSFKSDNNSGFLARAEAVRGNDSGAVRDQFSRLEVGMGNSFNMRDEGSSGAAASGGGERDWMNFASN